MPRFPAMAVRRRARPGRPRISQTPGSSGTRRGSRGPHLDGLHDPGARRLLRGLDAAEYAMAWDSVHRTAFRPEELDPSKHPQLHDPSPDSGSLYEPAVLLRASPKPAPVGHSGDDAA